MNFLPFNFLNKVQDVKSKYPSLFYLFIFIVIISILSAMYLTTLKLNKSEIKINKNIEVENTNTFKGRVTYSYKDGDDVIYDLYSELGEFIATLKVGDKRLQVVEGLFVEIKGTLIKSRESTKNKDIIIVDQVSVQSKIE